MTIAVTLGRELFAFKSHAEWCDTARWRFERCGELLADTVCLDAKGRICTRGLHFAQADEEGAFPIVVYAVREAAERSKA